MSTKWSKEKAISDLMKIKAGLFTELSKDCTDPKVAKLLVDIIKEINAICGIEDVADSENRGFEVNIRVVDNVSK